MVEALGIDWTFAGQIAVALGLGSLLQGYTGFGGGIVGVALLSLTANVIDATAATNVCSVATTIGILSRLWRHVRWSLVWPLLIGQAVGLPLGLAFLSAVDDTWARRVMGVLILGFAAWSYLGRKGLAGESMDRRIVGVVGLASGLMGGAFCMSGPPVIAYIYSQRLPRDTLKATVQVCFVFNTVIRLVLAIAAGHVGLAGVMTAGVAVPVVLLAVGLGLWLAGGVPNERFRYLAWGVFGGLGLLLCVR